jgi:hypothetical protein
MQLTKNMLVYLQHLSESPNIVYYDPTDDQLNDRGMNVEIAQQVKQGAIVDDVSYSNSKYKLYLFENRYYILNSASDYVLAMFSGIQSNKGFRFTDVWQYRPHTGLAREIVFNFFLKKFEFVQSDWSHTKLGMKYWQKLLESALYTNHKCSVVFYNGHEEYFDNINVANTFWSQDVSYGDCAFRIYK